MQRGQTATCNRENTNTVEITVHEAVPVEENKSARGYWYRDYQEIREIMEVVWNRGGRTIIRLGTVKMTSADDRPKSWKDLAPEDIKNIITKDGEFWLRYTDVSVNLL